MSGKSFRINGKVYRAYESHTDFYDIKEVETPKTTFGSFICGFISIGGIYYAAKILRLI